MTRARCFAVLTAAAVIGLLSGCGPKRVQAPAAAVPVRPPARDVIVLLPDADRGTVGGAFVTNTSGTVDLAMLRASTTVSLGQPPAPPTALSEAEVQQLFADVLSTLPPPPRNFTLYFRFESDELTEESRALVPEILRAVMDRPVPEVVVVGHTDTTGTPDANVALGLRRATAVRKILLDAGLDGSLIDVTSHGEAEPLVPTPNATYEPRNRRAGITVR